jgi:hypothetical protein
MGEDSFQRGEMRALIQRGRQVRPAPDLVRARALLRARAALVAGPSLAEVESAFRHARRVRVAVATVLALLGGAVAAAVVHAPTPGSVAMSAVDDANAARVPTFGVARRGLVAPAPQAGRAAKPTRAGRPPATLQPAAAELHLLRRAQAAYVRGDQRATLALVAEHAQLFPYGRMAEERDALRVQALAECGRKAEARRAAATFAARYPRSVLLSQMHEAANLGW